VFRLSVARATSKQLRPANGGGVCATHISSGFRRQISFAMPSFLTLQIGLLTLVVWTSAAETLYPCTPQQAATDGSFKCLPNCDENHKVYGTDQYCLNYFPNGGQCYLEPYARQDVLSCNGQLSSSSPPMWLVLIGGSNQFLMLKTLLDNLLNLPGNAGYNPTAYWNAHRK
jgi:hypothetical protein